MTTLQDFLDELHKVTRPMGTLESAVNTILDEAITKACQLMAEETKLEKKEFNPDDPGRYTDVCAGFNSAASDQEEKTRKFMSNE